MRRRGPRYDLSLVQELIEDRDRFIITKEAFRGAGKLGFDSNDIEECVKDLCRDDYDKSLTTTQNALHLGSIQDVYLITWYGVPIYLKLQIDGGILVVIQFKRDDSV